MKIDLSIEQAEIVRRLIAAIASESEKTPSRDIARDLDALPAYVTLGGSLAIRPDGTVLGYNSESQNFRNPDEGEITLVLVQLAKKYIELKDLAPTKAASALRCPSCNGIGQKLDFICGECNGTGWISDGSDHSSIE